MPRRRKLVFRRPDSPFWYCHVRNERGKIVDRSTKCTDETAAIAVAKQYERESTDPSFAAAYTTTLAEALSEFIASKAHRAADTIDFYEKKGGHLLRIFGKDRLIARIQATQVDEYIDQRRTEKVESHTIGKELTVLRGTLKLMRRRGKYPYSLDEVMPIGWDSEYEPRTRWLKPQEVDALVGALLKPNNADVDDKMPSNRAAFVLFGVATGARLAEIRRAQREDINFGTGFVRLRGTKTKRAERLVPILPHTEPMLRRALKLAKSDGPLFDKWQNVGRDLPVACAQAGIPDCSPNDLRRTFGKWLRRGGVAVDLVGDALGHVDSRMAEKIYSKLDPDELAALLKSVSILGTNNKTGATSKTKEKPGKG